MSPNDDRIRLDVARNIYRTETLERYGFQVNPSIHIIVKNGNVTLEGVVDNESDKNIAGLKTRDSARRVRRQEQPARRTIGVRIPGSVAGRGGRDLRRADGDRPAHPGCGGACAVCGQQSDRAERSSGDARSARRAGWRVDRLFRDRQTKLLAGRSWKDGDALRALQHDRWTLVVLQQGPSSLPESQVSLREYAARFAAEVRRLPAGVALYGVWPPKARGAFFDAVTTSYARAADDVGGVLVPVGEGMARRLAPRFVAAALRCGRLPPVTDGHSRRGADVLPEHNRPIADWPAGPGGVEEPVAARGSRQRSHSYRCCKPPRPRPMPGVFRPVALPRFETTG